MSSNDILMRLREMARDADEAKESTALQAREAALQARWFHNVMSKLGDEEVGSSLLDPMDLREPLWGWGEKPRRTRRRDLHRVHARQPTRGDRAWTVGMAVLSVLNGAEAPVKTAEILRRLDENGHADLITGGKRNAMLSAFLCRLAQMERPWLIVQRSMVTNRYSVAPDLSGTSAVASFEDGARFSDRVWARASKEIALGDIA